MVLSQRILNRLKGPLRELPSSGDLAHAKTLLRAAGYTVSPSKMSKSYFDDVGLQAETIFDIGVNKGTPGLYRAFKDKTIVLIDPRAESITATIERFPEYSFLSEACAAGNTNDQATLYIPERGGRSSIHKRAPLTASKVSEIREVPVRRLDEIVASLSLSGPFGIKIDTEGNELEVLRGSIGILPQTEFIIAETSVKRRFEDGYRFSDLVIFMRENGFELLDTMTFKRRPSAWIDCLFVKSGSHFFG